MNSLSPIFALVVFLITFCTAYLLGKKKMEQGSSKHRYESIDGLRGFLAVSVFIYHASIWYAYLQSGKWEFPDSNLFAQLGQTGVALFFMISSFLFINRLLLFNGEKYNWNSFFIKRFFRLAPVHFFIVAGIVLIAFYETYWVLTVDLLNLSKSLIRWFSFGIFNVVPINDFADTWMINAGVLWSLPYEWLLYFSLPLLSIVLLKKRPPLVVIMICLAFIITTLLFRDFYLEHLLSFAGGAIAPFFLKYYKTKVDFNHYLFSLTIIAALIAIVQFSSPSNIFCKLFITIAFTLIALGNDIFGILKSSTLKLLGDISYSTYLLHGVVLYVSINNIYGAHRAQDLSPSDYCLFIFIISPFVILLSYLSFRFIEWPFMRIGKRLADKA